MKRVVSAVITIAVVIALYAAMPGSNPENEQQAATGISTGPSTSHKLTDRPAEPTDLSSRSLGLATKGYTNTPPGDASNADATLFDQFDPMWGMTAAEIASNSSSQPAADESLARDYFDTIAKGRWSNAEFDFDVTYRGQPGEPGEPRVSIVNLDLRGDMEQHLFNDLAGAFTRAHGKARLDINDENQLFRLTRQTWVVDGSVVILAYADDFIGKDSISIEYRKAPPKSR